MSKICLEEQAFALNEKIRFTESCVNALSSAAHVESLFSHSVLVIFETERKMQMTLQNKKEIVNQITLLLEQLIESRDSREYPCARAERGLAARDDHGQGMCSTC